MSFIDDSKKNVEFIKEVSGGSVGGFTGRAGMGIDALFAGPYHPDSGHGSQNKKLLAKQLKDRREKRKDLNSDRDDVLDDYSGLADPVGGYYEVETEYAELAYDELEQHFQNSIDYNIEVTPPQDIEWKSSGWDYDYDEFDKSMGRDRRNTNFDEFDKSMGRDRRNKIFDKDFINKSEENIEKTIKEEEIQLNEKDFVNCSEINTENTIKEEEIQLTEEDFINRSEINLQTIYKNNIGLSISIGG